MATKTSSSGLAVAVTEHPTDKTEILLPLLAGLKRDLDTLIERQVGDGANSSNTASIESIEKILQQQKEEMKEYVDTKISNLTEQLSLLLTAQHQQLLDNLQSQKSET